MKKKILFLTIGIITHLTHAQVLFTEDFNSYPAGHLNTDYTGNTAGQGGWLTERQASAATTAMVTPETGKGNVVTFTTNVTSNIENLKVFQDTGVISALWNSRTAGNNVLKYEYEVYGTGFFNAYGNLYNLYNFPLLYLRFASTTGYYIETNTMGTGGSHGILKNYTATTFPHNMWIKVEFFIDYNTKKAYWYIPTLNLSKTDDITTANILPDNISIHVNWLKPGSIVKYDNIKLTALPSVPSYILSANEIVSAKFNMYPNPATNVVNITNSENMLVEQVTIYDISGKQLSVQKYNNETQIHLNVENLASGTYMLHIQTNAGLAVKRLVKK